ncbi:hypothetical protein EFN63_01535 [Leuconostoc citreum]|uniref:hypothetical protein n=1 Tax=Leuconostoc citreum TaxID=33964 RepID=UPI001058FFB1|nr:hypothetical protein [Leuconostoc citreum]MCT3067055.1 hypothetical protein [Leuconostoc citreum]TDG65678.1 hypothetical protein C5L21_000881 [Leuconostoc citreum]
MAGWTSVNVLYASKIFGNPQPFTTAIGSADISSIGLLNGAKGVGISVSENPSIVIIDWTELTQLARPILAPVQ